MKRLDDKTINYIAIISAIFIFIYECYLKYVFPKPICSIIIQLSYSYIGSYIFYKLLNERDKNNNKEKVENSLVPMLRENVEIYIEFIKIFKTHKHWSTLDKNEFKEMVKGIRCNDILGEYGFFKKEVVYKRTYLEYIQ